MKLKLFNLVLLISLSSSLYSQVILYRSCNYVGISKSLGTGYHNLAAMGIGNDNLSSIQVPNGYSITLYMDDNFKGAKTVYSEDVSCLPLGWNNEVSSVYISYSLNNNGRWNNNVNNDVVTLYRDCNYQGYSKTLGEGSYKVYELGIGNDQLSSIRVPNGYAITLYVDDNFQGASTIIEDDISCLPYNWNNIVSSVSITRNRNNNNWWNNNNNNNNANAVTLFSNCSYQGTSKSFGVGSYNNYELGIGNNQLSSIRVSNGYTITIYQDDNYQGTSTVYNDDISCLPWNWNNKVSSIVISQAGGYNPGGWNNNNNAMVTLYQDCSYGGASSSLGIGYHTLYAMGMSNDALSSLRVPNGYYIILYVDDNFQGASTTINNDTYCLPGNWNDRVSSVYVGKSGNNNNVQNNFGTVTLYEECNYNGASNTLGVGYHDLRELGIRNDALSSLRIANGYSVVLYKDENFQGSQTTVSADVSCLGFLWNNVVTSIRVFRSQ